MKSALIIIDTQYDFLPDGGYPVPQGNQVVQPLNQAISFAKKNKWLIVASKDWHAREIFDDPNKVHCVQNTPGAEIHHDLNLDRNTTIITKGASDLSPRHHSAFNGDILSLQQVFKDHDIEDVYIGGLAYDYCVKQTALDSVNRGFNTFIIKDATRAVKNSPKEISNLETELTKADVKLISLEDLLS